MNQKYFKYENKNHKKIRIKDLLMLFTVFALCILTAVVAGISVNRKMNMQANLNMSEAAEDTNTTADKNNEFVVDAQTVNNELNQSSQTESESNEDIATPQFIKPVNGGILKPFSPDDLLYSETMDDWRIHLGVDISCPFKTEIVSAESGDVESITYDINYGTTVTVRTGEYEHIYSSLSSEVYVTEGQHINKGDIIGFSSDSCMSEICDDPHIHFEMKKNGIYINPTDLIKFH